MISLVLAAAISWPVRYNDGVTTYWSNDFAAAASSFEQATASPDRALQQRAFYNLGNTNYRLGEVDPTKAQPLWEQAIKSYETALALDPKDEDAKFNRDLVKKKLEELQKQREQQQQQQNQKNQDQRDKQKEQKQDQQQQSQQQDQQQPKQDQQNQQQQDKQQQDQQQPKPDESKPTQQPRERQAQQPQPGNLDRQQAKALLDNLREDERNWNFFPEVQMKDLKDSGEPAKDW